MKQTVPRTFPCIVDLPKICFVAALPTSHNKLQIAEVGIHGRNLVLDLLPTLESEFMSASRTVRNIGNLLFRLVGQDHHRSGLVIRLADCELLAGCGTQSDQQHQGFQTLR